MVVLLVALTKLLNKKINVIPMNRIAIQYIKDLHYPSFKSALHYSHSHLQLIQNCSIYALPYKVDDKCYNITGKLGSCKTAMLINLHSFISCELLY